MNYIHIGKIIATHGVQGEMIIAHVLKKKTTFKNIEAIFIEEQKQSYIPYFIEKAKATNEEETICKLEGINSKESARRFIKKNIWLTGEDFSKLADKNSPLALINYLVVDNKKTLSKVEEVIEQPHQILLKIFLHEKEVLIPLHAETLHSINHRKREIHVVLPEGLLDIYTKY